MKSEVQKSLDGLEYEKTDEDDGWMKGVTAIVDSVLDGKGIVKEMHSPTIIETKFGKRKVSRVDIEVQDKRQITVSLFLPPQFSMVHPKSGLAKLMAYYKCVELEDLIGKEVELVSVGDMMWKIKVE